MINIISINNLLISWIILNLSVIFYLMVFYLFIYNFFYHNKKKIIKYFWFSLIFINIFFILPIIFILKKGLF